MEVSVLSHVTNSALVIWGLEYLKRKAWFQKLLGAVPVSNGKLYVLLSGIGAAIGTLGMHGAVEGNYVEGWKLALTIPPLWVILHAAWDLAQQMTLNQIGFAALVKQKAAAPVMTQAVTPKVSVTVPLETAEVKP